MASARGVRRHGTSLISILVILPSVLLVGLFVYGFIGRTIYLSLTDWGTGTGLALDPRINLAGLSNYRELFTGIVNARFRQDLVNTFFYTLFVLAGTIVTGLLFAVFLDRELTGGNFFKTLFLYPMGLSFIVTGTIWRWLLAPNGGVNLIPTWFGGDRWEFLWISSRQAVLVFNWQNVPAIMAAVAAAVLLVPAAAALRRKRRRKAAAWGVPAALAALVALLSRNVFPAILPFPEEHGFNLAAVGIIVTAVWQYSGYTMAIFLAGLRGLPEGLRESAALDGAGEVTYYRKIALPNIRPMLFTATIILAHISLKMFDLIFAMAGPDNASTGHLSILMYLTTFRANRFASGAAIAVVQFTLAAAFIIPYLLYAHRRRRAT